MSHPNKKKTETFHDVLKLPEAGPDQGSVHLQTGFHHAGSGGRSGREPEGCSKILPVSCAAEIDYRGVERVVRINGLDTPHWKEDIRVCVAGGADTIRIAKTETAQDVHTVEEHVLAAEREFGRPEGSTLLMAALESCKGVLNALEVCKSSDRLIGIALSGGDYTRICRP